MITQRENNSLKNYRVKKGFTQAMVANVLGISVSHYCNIENGNRGINYSYAKRLSACLGISVDNIYRCLGYWRSIYAHW